MELDFSTTGIEHIVTEEGHHIYKCAMQSKGIVLCIGLQGELWII